MYRFGELNVERVRRILAGDVSPEPAPPPGKPPELCPGCPHRSVFEALRKLDCIVSGDIGCYSLGVLPPFEAMDTLVCMGAGIGVGLGLRHVLPPEQARRVVSVIGDSTFVHSGITGLVEMVYNPPPTGHVLIILDNGTTAMTGHAGAPRHGPHARSPAHRQGGLRGPGARRSGIKQRPRRSTRRSSRRRFEDLVARCLGAGELARDRRAPHLPAGRRQDQEYEQMRRSADEQRSNGVTNVVIAGPGRPGRAQGLRHPGRRRLPRRAST